jgi:CheY-like chemotaxis protein
MDELRNGNLEKLDQVVKERGSPFKILIVDDEQWVREVFKDFCDLTNAFEIDLAGSGTEAVSKASSNKYDLITMDLIMPEISGLEALREIKRVSPRVPVMVITGNATDKVVNEAGIIGACKVLYKPVILDDFLSELTGTLLRTSQADG